MGNVRVISFFVKCARACLMILLPRGMNSRMTGRRTASQGSKCPGRQDSGEQAIDRTKGRRKNVMYIKINQWSGVYWRAITPSVMVVNTTASLEGRT